MNLSARLDDLLRAAASRSPEAIAIESGEERWTYARLDETASRVAGALRSRGIGMGDRVAFCLAKSPRSVAILFGAMRAGAIFVPLDPAAPPARHATILKDCAARGLFGEGRSLSALLAACGAARPELIVDLGGAGGPSEAGSKVVEWREALGAPPLESSGGGEGDPAYILYTSGSTGVPKGVVISHLNALAFTSWARREFVVGPDDRVTSVAPFHFDLSTFDLYATVEGGGTVLLVPREVTLFPAALAGFLESSRATVTYLVPSTLTGMFLKGDLAARRLESLRLILFAGEVLPVTTLRLLIDAFPGARCANLYGPTETNVCTWYEVRAQDRERDRPLPIGSACSGDSAFAVDEDGTLVTDPEREGELLVAGPTVALGYWGDPAKSAAAFLPGHPHAPAGARVYRTGDIVTRDEAGLWLYRGRRDHQVKSRGYRIELGEIEAALHAHAAIAEAAALAIPDPEAGNRIVACAVAREGTTAPSQADLLRHCMERLPRFMVPERVELLDALPKTSTGKIDRTALRALFEGPRGG